MKIREVLRSIPVFGKLISQIRSKYVHRNYDPKYHLQKAFQHRTGISVVQIGSNDGSTGDPINSLLNSNSTWNALFVEPVPFLFDRLRQNYPDKSNYRFENVAIDEYVGIAKFYYVDSSAKEMIVNLPNWYDQLGSFDPDHIKKHFGSTLDAFILAKEIPTITLTELIERNNINTIDLLHIDTEGHDWIILRQLNLSKYRPEVILVEHKHLDETSKADMLSFLKHDYKVIDLGYDYFCKRR